VLNCYQIYCNPCTLLAPLTHNEKPVKNLSQFYCKLIFLHKNLVDLVQSLHQMIHNIFVILILCAAANSLSLPRLVQVKDACNEDDQVVASKENLIQLLVGCNSECYESSTCVSDCITKFGFTKSCSLCHAKEAMCLSNHCNSQCQNPTSAPCASCHSKFCSLVKTCDKHSVHLIN